MTRFATILLLALSPILHAQEPEKKDLKVRFLAERAPKEIGEVMMSAGEDKVSPAFTLPTNNVSEPQVAPAR
jgi:hypothetical protein